jgi:hypothetical protein
MNRGRKFAVSVGALLVLVTIGSTQLMAILKYEGMAAAVNTFGKDINKALNKLQNHTDTPAVS